MATARGYVYSALEKYENAIKDYDRTIHPNLGVRRHRQTGESRMPPLEIIGKQLRALIVLLIVMKQITKFRWLIKCSTAKI